MKIGIIGMSRGNGHPYSWSAIINGSYDQQTMDKCGFSGISTYLKVNSDILGIDGAEVTHIWTQDKDLSLHIAKASHILHVVDNLEDMIGHVDAVLLARDDANQHLEMAKPFIDVDIPIFIDKPLTSDINELAYYSKQIDAGKFIMSCSSMRYSTECRIAKTEMARLGKIVLITAIGKKDWIKYGVHMLEAVFALLDDPSVISVQNVGAEGKEVVHIEFSDIHFTLHLFEDISPTFQISIFGQEDWQHIDIKNFYAMFKENLLEVISSVREGTPRLAFYKTENIIRTLIAAKQSREENGKRIYIEH